MAAAVLMLLSRLHNYSTNQRIPSHWLNASEDWGLGELEHDDEEAQTALSWQDTEITPHF